MTNRTPLQPTIRKRILKAFAAATFLVSWLLSSVSFAQCNDWAAVVHNAEGDIEIRREGGDDWSPLRRGDLVCFDEPVRSGLYSRAELRLPNDTDVYLNEDTSIVFGPPVDESRTLLDFIRGVINVISRDPRALRVTTPYVDAGLEGTEFQIVVAGDRFELAVYDGTVDLESEVANIAIAEGQRVIAQAGSFGEPVPDDQERRDLLWALHYPPILDGPLPAPGQELPQAGADAAFFARRAHSRMTVGRIDAAREDIEAALAIEADRPDALAIGAMLSLAEGQVDTAERLVQRALESSPGSPAALIASSFLHLHRGAARAALETAEAAAARAPGSAVAHARRAEVLLALGAVGEAVAAADTALSLDAGVAPAYTVQGFAALRNGEIEAAPPLFEAAIRLDPAAPLPRVGLAFVMLRDGRGVEARQQLEIAVALDPNDSALRAYMSRLYSDELRSMLAGSQLEIARRLDAGDPTPKLYGAYHEQSRNRPIAALENLSEATAANGNRIPLRSRVYHDEDLVTRSAGPGRIYRSLGLERWALRAGSHALIADPADYSPHQLLGDVYSFLPRHQLARVSEALQARLLQPINVLPSPPQLGQVNDFILNVAGPSELARAGARSGFTTNGFDVQVSAIGASHGTRGESLVVSGLNDRRSFNLGQLHHETDGFRENNDFEHDALNAFVQLRPSSDRSLQLDLRSTRTARGDSILLFDPEDYDSLLRQHERTDSAQFGLSRRLSPFATVVGSFTMDQADLRGSSGSAFATSVLLERSTAELLILNDLPRWNIVSGLRAVRANLERASTVSIPVPVPPFILELTDFTDHRVRHLVPYLYAHRAIGDDLWLTAGASIDWLDGQRVDTRETNPKLGLTWKPGPDTYLNVALFQTILGTMISKQSTLPSLEPTHVAGFGQYLFGTEGERARNYAVAFDHAVAPKVRIGVEHTERSVDVPFLLFDPAMSGLVLSTFDVRESTDSAHLYWTPRLDLAFKARWQYEDFDYHGMSSSYRFTRLKTKRIPLEATMFVGDALSFRVTGTHARQDGLFEGTGPVPSLVRGESQFWVFDAAVDYRLPNRLGTLELGVRNLFDETFRFQDTDPENPQIFPEQFVLLRFTLSF